MMLEPAKAFVGTLFLGAMLACSPGAPTPKPEAGEGSAPQAEAGASTSVSGPQAGEALDASRIVSLGGATTETLFALGLGDQIVAVDSSSLFPEAATQLPQVGYIRAASAEGIVSLAPSLVVASADLGPPGLGEQLEGSGLTLLKITEERSIKGAKARIGALSRALGREEKGEALIQALDADLEALAKGRGAIVDPPSILFVYARGAGTLMVAGAKTGPDEMITLAGGRNAAGDVEGFKPLSAEAVLAAAPDLVLMTSRGSQSVGGEDNVLEVIGLPPGSLEHPPRLLTLDDNLLLSFGPRAGEGALALQGLLLAEVPATP